VSALNMGILGHINIENDGLAFCEKLFPNLIERPTPNPHADKTVTCFRNVKISHLTNNTTAVGTPSNLAQWAALLKSVSLMICTEKNIGKLNRFELFGIFDFRLRFSPRLHF